jgi:hypothetical protein
MVHSDSPVNLFHHRRPIVHGFSGFRTSTPLHLVALGQDVIPFSGKLI